MDYRAISKIQEILTHHEDVMKEFKDQSNVYYMSAKEAICTFKDTAIKDITIELIYKFNEIMNSIYYQYFIKIVKARPLNIVDEWITRAKSCRRVNKDIYGLRYGLGEEYFGYKVVITNDISHKNLILEDEPQFGSDQYEKEKSCTPDELSKYDNPFICKLELQKIILTDIEKLAMIVTGHKVVIDEFTSKYKHSPFAFS